jgi:hypothetical protein
MWGQGNRVAAESAIETVDESLVQLLIHKPA